MILESKFRLVLKFLCVLHFDTYVLIFLEPEIFNKLYLDFGTKGQKIRIKKKGSIVNILDVYML